MENLITDLRFGVRLLIKSPSFTLIAVVTLALGIGATTTIFSVINGVLLRPLEYHDPQEIVTLLNGGRGPVSPANFLDLKSGTQSFDQMAAAEAWGGTLTTTGNPEEIRGLRMGDGLFDLLGVAPTIGRTLQREDFEPGRDHVLVLSHKLWQRAFGGDPNVVGHQFTLSGEPYTVVGVMPPQFHFPPFWSTRAEMWAPLDLSRRASSRGGSSLRIFARLKTGVGPRQAQSEIDAMNARLATSFPDENSGLDIRVDPLNEKVVGDVRPALLILAGAVGFVLLISCANVACLLLARGASRQRETAVRAALGASRSRIVRQLFTESVVLSLCGAVAGVLLAVWGVDLLTTMLAGNTSSFSVRLPRLSEIRIDSTVLVFTLGLSMLTSLLFGLAPALGASKPDLNQVLKDSGRGVTGSRHRLREALVIAELAMALVMLIGAGLLGGSFAKLQAVNPGFNPANLLTLSPSLAGASRYVGSTREGYYRSISERLSALPGVSSVSAINHLPLAGDRWGLTLAVEGRPLPPPGQGIEVVFRVCRPDYFRTMGIPMRAGRDFTGEDKADAPGVVILNETLARRQWPNENPIGKRITLDDPRKSQPQWFTIVGIASDVKQDSWIESPSSEVYLPFQQSRGFYESTARQYTSMTVVVRTTVDPRTLIAAAQETVRNFDHNVPISEVVSMDQVVSDALWQPRFNLQLIGLFSAVAVALAAIGLYGVMTYSIAQRTHEVGLRMALGARRRDVVKLILAQGMKLASIGVAIGLICAALLTRLMTQLLFGVSATDPLTFAGIAVLLTAIALVACFIPAHRATRVDPMEALRCE